MRNIITLACTDCKQRNYTTTKNKRTMQNRLELKKVTWPTPKQTLASTSVVIIVVIIVSTFLGIVDFGLTKIVKLILG